MRNNKEKVLENLQVKKAKKILPSKEKIEEIKEKVEDKKSELKDKMKDKKGGTKITTERPQNNT